MSPRGAPRRKARPAPSAQTSPRKKTPPGAGAAELFARLMDFTQDAVYRYTFAEGRILFASSGLVRILDLDCSPEELVGRKLQDLLIYTQEPGTVRKQADPKGQVHDFEYGFKTLKGEERWVLHDSFVTKDPATGEKVVSAFVRDITKRKQAQEALTAQRRQLSVTLRCIGDGVIAADRQGRAILLNKAAEELTGWSEAEALGKPLTEIFRIIDERTRRPGADPVRRVLAEGRIQGLANHTALISRDGTERSIADSAAPILDEAGSVIGAVLTFQDVTERRRAEEAVRQSAERYRSLFDSMLNGFAYCRMLFEGDDPRDFVYLEVNPAFGKLTGLKQVVGRKVSEVIPGIREADPGLFEVYGRVARTGMPEKFETYVAALRQWFTISVYSPSRDHFVAVFDVITERKKAEQELQLAAEFLSLVNECRGKRDLLAGATRFWQERSGCAAVGIRLREGDDYPYFETRGFPPEFVRLENTLCARDAAGRPERDTAGFPVLRCMCGDVIRGSFDRAQPFFTVQGSFWTNSTSKLRAGAGEAGRQARTLDRCNEAGYESVALLPLRFGDERLGVIQFNDPRPDRFTLDSIHLWERLAKCLAAALAKALADEERASLLQRAQEARAQAEAANRSKDEFLARVSHELRTPITAILGWHWLLRSGDLSAEEREKAMEVIARKMEAEKQIIDDLLDISGLVSGRLDIKKRTVDLGPLVAETAGGFRSEFQAKSLRLVCAPAAGLFVSGDPRRLRQVIWNLVSNAVKFTPAGGTVTVLARREGGKALVSVEDTGPGISHEFYGKLFELFGQEESTLTRTHGGLGLGLAIVQHLVRQHGGEVAVAPPVPGQGARVTVSLPLAAAAPTGSPPEPFALAIEAPPDFPGLLRGVRILVVEDDDDTREMLLSVLGHCGARVQGAVSTAEGLAAFASARPDVLLCDIGLPGEDGYSLIRRIRALGKGAGGLVPAVAVTAYSTAEDRAQALRAGFQTHLPKPVDPAELVAMVRALAKLPGSAAR
ncbi:MAG: hypothetical protein A2X36_01370 [Elusimicrobia bacterium GWA2_69_24]|nr:MAG: hypothetical protein A2X36_01370 [Elusimicrobia bacterium GWA2_69_24]HBL18857.1 hypothetical protein [Elusimicrobiota bacterium]